MSACSHRTHTHTHTDTLKEKEKKTFHFVSILIYNAMYVSKCAIWKIYGSQPINFCSFILVLCARCVCGSVSIGFFFLFSLLNFPKQKFLIVTVVDAFFGRIPSIRSIKFNIAYNCHSSVFYLVKLACFLFCCGYGPRATIR